MAGATAEFAQGAKKAPAKPDNPRFGHKLESSIHADRCVFRRIIRRRAIRVLRENGVVFC